jgi:hypothetical protein
MIQLDVKSADRVVQRTEQQLQKNAGGLKRALPDLADPIDEQLTNIVQDRPIASPEGQDALPAAKQG